MKEEKSLMKNMMYYTPEITDFKIGYECEANITVFKIDEGWIPCTLKGVGPEVIHYHSLGVYRTRYLSKQDIEDQNWEFITHVTSRTKRFKKDNWMLLYNFENQRLRIIKDWGKDKEPIIIIQNFDGICPSINELRTIEKLLKIK